VRSIRIQFVFWAILMALLNFPLSLLADEERPYTVQCSGDTCEVDKKTYIGWRTYHANCHVCHAQDAVGSTFAPSLVDALKKIDKERFLHSVAEGYKGQIGVMPPWKDNPNVNKYFEELYAYLKARSDGVLPPGKPKRLK
jgi:mono/diheme cytochrome c family protein